VSFSRRFLERITVSGRVASDHTRILDTNGWPTGEELIRATNEWYWAAGVSVGF
jgi:hypothetical protein